MFDWHSEYLLIRARQREIACQAELRRRLVEGRLAALQGESPRLRRTLAYRVGAALIVIGRALQGPSTSGK
jgi:hypothetical protein